MDARKRLEARPQVFFGATLPTVREFAASYRIATWAWCIFLATTLRRYRVSSSLSFDLGIGRRQLIQAG